MVYIVAFVIGGCARSAAKALIFAVLYVILYWALMFAISALASRSGASVSRMLENLATDGAVVFAVIAFGYLCRVVVGQRLARAADDRQGMTAVFD